LAFNYRKLVDYVQLEIKRDSRNAALMFLRIAKHNMHMKTEFSIFRKLDRLDARFEFSQNPIRKVILNVLHTFFVDFTNKRVYVYVEEYNGRVNIDYESIQVALYHLIENATKYTMPDTEISILFENKGDIVDVIFKMKSLFLDNEEVEKIFTEGYSGKVAKQCKLSGDGIGMWQINRMMKLNQGSVEFINGSEIQTYEGKQYADNKMILSFRRK
jgi:K+-sensing histidine kinase KdpD